MANLIDRQAALDAIEQAAKDNVADANYHYLMGYQDAAEAVEQVPAVQQWIPITDRLPEYAGVYLCTIQSGEHYSVMMCTWIPARQMWMPLMYGNHDNVIAWVPLPEPYRKEATNENRT